MSSDSRVYWITGLSNSGKTTIGTALYYELKKKRNDVVILDGDLMKEIASGTETAQFSDRDRLIRAKRYSKMAKLLADQGIVVIVCAIAMYNEVREWNRNNIKNYIEIFLNTPDSTRKKRDKKGLYQVEKGVQFPQNPDLIFLNDGSEPIRNIVKTIIEYEPVCKEEYDRDKDYWNAYYSQNAAGIENKPSEFAKFIEVGYLSDKNPAHILELGCGNGRDSLFFLARGHKITAIDGSNVAIEMLNRITDSNNALFVCDDFVKSKALYQMKYDCIYSRFTLHAISEKQEDELLNNVKDALNSNGILAIEARTTNDDLYGKGIEVENNAFLYNEHYRRFINVSDFSNKLEKMGFEVLYLVESNGFSRTQNSDPVLMRCICTAKTD